MITKVLNPQEEKKMRQLMRYEIPEIEILPTFGPSTMCLRSYDLRKYSALEISALIKGKASPVIVKG